MATTQTTQAAEIERRIARAFAEDMIIFEAAPEFFRVLTAGGEYFADAEAGVCSCPDARYRTNEAANVECKHLYQIRHFYCGGGSA